MVVVDAAVVVVVGGGGGVVGGMCVCVCVCVCVCCVCVLVCVCVCVCVMCPHRRIHRRTVSNAAPVHEARTWLIRDRGSALNKASCDSDDMMLPCWWCMVVGVGVGV
jgi:hypothetical protein